MVLRKYIPFRWLSLRLYGVWEYVARPSLRNWSGGPYNGQALRQRLMAEILRCQPWQAIVETGTFRGETTEAFVRSGVPTFSIEVNPHFFVYARLRLWHARLKARLCLGDSRHWLRRFAADPRFPRGRVLFYLDAHWLDELPLREEIELAFTHWPDALIVIDDFEVPGSAYGYDDYGPGKRLRLDYLDFLRARSPFLFFPSALFEQETGARRGCVVLCLDRELAAVLHGLPGLTPETDLDPKGTEDR